MGNEGIIDAAAMAAKIKTNDHHIALVIPRGIDGLDLAEKIISQITQGAPDLKDYCYVFNYKRPEVPVLITLPAGLGKNFKNDVDGLIKNLLITLSQFDPAPFHMAMRDKCLYRVDELNAEFEAKSSPIRLRVSDSPQGGVNYYATFTDKNNRNHPIIQLQNMSPKTPEEDLRQKAFDAYEEAKKDLQKVMYEIFKLPQEANETILGAKKEIIKTALDKLKKKYSEHQKVLKYFSRLEEDIVNHLSLFDFTGVREGDCQTCRRGITEVCDLHSRSGYFSRFAVNLFVDNSKQKSAPVIKVGKANCSELFGVKTETHSHEGGVHRHTGIIAGAFHKANQGYLLVEAAKLLRQASVLDAFTNTLENNEVSIESLMSIMGVSDHSESLRPEKFKLDLKVILVIDEGTYQLLKSAEHWIGLTKFFEIKAKVKPDMTYNGKNVDAFRHLLLNSCQEEGLRTPDTGAQVRLVEYGLELAGGQTKMSLQTKIFMNLLQQADYFAEKNGHASIKKADVIAAIEAKEKRHGGFQERFLESVKLGHQTFNTNGHEVGDINGLFVARTPDGSIIDGPLRLTCNIGLGKEGVVSIDKNVGTDGPQHRKWFEILSGFF